jgi:protein-tyrosine phosphatase
MATKRLYRADDPIRLTAGGRAAVEQLGLAGVIDVRQDLQVRRSPGFCGPDLTIHLPLMDQVIDRDAPPPLERPEHLADLYETMLGNASPAFARALDVLAERLETGPTLVHCAYGKDRTGLIVAMVQALLGVADHDIVAEYALSDEPVQARRRWLLSEPRHDDPDIAKVSALLFTAPAGAMQVLLERLGQRHGSTQAWVHSLPVHDDTPERLQHALITR